MAKAKATTKTAAKGKGKAEKEAPAKGKGKAVKEEVKEAPAKGKKAAAAPKEKAKATKGKAKAETRGRGRVAGVRSEVQKKDIDAIQNQFSTIENEFDAFAENVNKFLVGNKSSVGKARKNIQAIIRMGKEVRKTLQEAKINMKQVKV